MVYVPEVARYKCLKRCGWYRDVPTRAERQNRVIDHKIYGPIRTLDLTRLDVLNHDCHEYQNAKIRIGKLQAQRSIE